MGLCCELVRAMYTLGISENFFEIPFLIFDKQIKLHALLEVKQPEKPMGEFAEAVAVLTFWAPRYELPRAVQEPANPSYVCIINYCSSV